jgi:hypothetical protein
LPKAEEGASTVDMLGHIAVGVVAILLVGLTLGYLARNDWAMERRVRDAKVSNLAAQALMPGSALPCLDPIASEGFESGCEKALFATPETTAAAIAFVAAQLSLMASASEAVSWRSPSNGSALTTLRRSLEADRFGIVAYVLAAEHGCTPDRCVLLHSCKDLIRYGQIWWSAHSKATSKDTGATGRLQGRMRLSPMRLLLRHSPHPLHYRNLPETCTSRHRPRSRRSTS